MDRKEFWGMVGRHLPCNICPTKGACDNIRHCAETLQEFYETQVQRMRILENPRIIKAGKGATK